MILQDQPSQSEHLSSAVSRGEQRDAQRAMDHWRRNTWASEGVPLLDTFDFSPMKGDWGYRFLIRGDGTSENAVFVTYGLKLAQLLRLPTRHSLTTYRRYTDQCSLRAIAELFRKERPSISRARSVVAPRSNYTGRFLCPSCCSHTGRSSWFLEHSTARQPALPKRTMRCCLEGRVLRHHNRAGAVPSS
jgi:hypothetical protein